MAERMPEGFLNVEAPGMSIDLTAKEDVDWLERKVARYLGGGGS